MSALCRLFISSFLKKPTTTNSTGLLSRNLQTKQSSKVTSYCLNKYVSFVKSYEKVLVKKFPAVIKFYQVFSVGFKYYKEDILLLWKILKKLNAAGWECLTRRELEIYYTMPRNLLRSAPVLLIAAGVPFGGFFFFVAYNFPRQLLTPHFWSLQQKSELPLINHKKKLKYYKPVFRLMQNSLLSIKDDPLYMPMKEVLDRLGSGGHPSIDLIISCKPLFESHPYGLQCLSRSHVVGLLKIHEMHRGWQRKKRLERAAKILQLMDFAILKEGGVEKLTQDELKFCCFLRGLNPITMRDEDILNWLNSWLTISQEIEKNSLSLLLHCPVLLGYNQPSNWWLLHDKRLT